MVLKNIRAILITILIGFQTMVLPKIFGMDCTSSKHAHSRFPPIKNCDKICQIWSTVHSEFQEIESKLQKCAPLLHKPEKREIYRLPLIFQNDVKEILSDDRSLEELVISKLNSEIAALSRSNTDCKTKRQKPTRKSSKKKQQHSWRNNFCTIAVSWRLRRSNECYTRQELFDIFTAFGPIKNVRFLSLRCAEIEYVWLGSACLAVRAPSVRLPGKATLRRRWADTSIHRKLWCMNDSHVK